MRTKRVALATWIIFAFVSGSIASVVALLVLDSRQKALSNQQAARMMSNLITHHDRDIRFLLLPPGGERGRIAAYAESNFEDIAEKLFAPSPTSAEELKIAQFLKSNQKEVNLPASIFVRRVSDGYLIRIESGEGAWVLRKTLPSGEYSLVGLK